LLSLPVILPTSSCGSAVKVFHPSKASTGNHTHHPSPLLLVAAALSPCRPENPRCVATLGSQRGPVKDREKRKQGTGLCTDSVPSEVGRTEPELSHETSRQYVGCGCRSGRSRMASVRVGIWSSICLLCPKSLARLEGGKRIPCIYLRSDLPSVGIYLQSGPTNLHDIGTPTSDGSYTAQCITAAHHICRRTVGVGNISVSTVPGECPKLRAHSTSRYLSMHQVLTVHARRSVNTSVDFFQIIRSAPCLCF
jgi:hypothetical protein